jgi:Na+-driven multidrug efflux pump
MDRVVEAVRLAVRFCICAGVALLLAAYFGAPTIVTQFTDDAEVGRYSIFYLRVVAVGYGLTGLVLIASQALNALRRPLPAMAINLCRTIAVTVPCAVVGHWAGGIHGTFVGIAVGGATCGALAWAVMSRVVHQETLRLSVPKSAG